MCGRISLLLCYQPANSPEGPIRLAQIEDPQLTVRAANRAVEQAKYRAARIAMGDKEIGRIEKAEAKRLANLLSVLIPAMPEDQQSKVEPTHKKQRCKLRFSRGS